MSKSPDNAIRVVGQFDFPKPLMNGNRVSARLQSIPFTLKTALTNPDGTKGEVQDMTVEGSLELQWTTDTLSDRIELMSLYNHWRGKPVELFITKGSEYKRKDGTTRNNFNVVVPDGNAWYASIKEATTLTPLDVTIVGEHNVL